MTLGAHTAGTETIVDHMNEDNMLIKGLSPKRYLMLALFAVAVYINEVPLFGDARAVNQSSYIEYFMFFPMFYTSIHWLEEVGMYQTMMFAMVFQTIGILVSKTAIEGDQAQNAEYVGQALTTVAQVYIFNGITKFTSTWFDLRSRSVATAIIILFGHLG